MRAITGTLTPELVAHCGGSTPDKAEAFHVTTFRKLVEHVAKLSYINNDDLLFFRGQSSDYKNRAGGTTLFPAIYRGDVVPEREVKHKFDILDQACRLLTDRWKTNKIEGIRDIRLKRHVQWSILQHYEVCDTPLLDVTHSLRVACSFAQMKKEGGRAFVYVLGLPHVSNRISVNSEHDIVNVRLLSICPPDALRPHFQEGYMVGTTDITFEYDNKTELDFKNRLIAKFSIPDTKEFWGAGFNIIPQNALYPKGDRILRLCEEIKADIKDELLPGDMGAFMRQWADVEEIVVVRARHLAERNLSLGEAISRLFRANLITSGLAHELETLRRFRNTLVHTPSKVTASETNAMRARLVEVLASIKTNSNLRI